MAPPRRSDTTPSRRSLSGADGDATAVHPGAADPREWPRLRRDRFRTAPRVDPVETEADRARWRREERIDRLVIYGMLVLAFAIVLGIAAFLVWAFVIFLHGGHGAGI